MPEDAVERCLVRGKYRAKNAHLSRFTACSDRQPNSGTHTYPGTAMPRG